MAVNQQGIRNILRYNAGLLNINIIDIVNNVDSLALARISRLDDPNVLLALVLLQLLVVIVEIAKLLRQDVRIRRQIKRWFPELLLHAHNVEAQAVLARDFV